MVPKSRATRRMSLIIRLLFPQSLCFPDCDGPLKKQNTQKKQNTHTHKRQHSGKPEATLYSQAWGNNLGPHTPAVLTIRKVWYPEDSQQQHEFSKVSKMCWATGTCLLRSGCLKQKRKHCYVTWMLFWRFFFFFLQNYAEVTFFKSNFFGYFLSSDDHLQKSSSKLLFYFFHQFLFVSWLWRLEIQVTN